MVHQHRNGEHEPQQAEAVRAPDVGFRERLGAGQPLHPARHRCQRIPSELVQLRTHSIPHAPATHLAARRHCFWHETAGQGPGRLRAVTGLIDPIPAGTARTSRLTWLFAFLGFFLVLGAWSVAAPYSGTPDEQDHILRAYGVATGQVVLDPSARPARRRSLRRGPAELGHRAMLAVRFQHVGRVCGGAGRRQTTVRPRPAPDGISRCTTRSWAGRWRCGRPGSACSSPAC